MRGGVQIGVGVGSGGTGVGSGIGGIGSGLRGIGSGLDHDLMPTVTIAVRVQPRAKRDELVALRGGVLVARVTAPPLEGRANDALRRLLSERLGVRAADVTIVRGLRGRDKVVRIDGIDQAAFDAALATLRK